MFYMDVNLKSKEEMSSMNTLGKSKNYIRDIYLSRKGTAW